MKVFWTKKALKQRNLVFSYWNHRNKSLTYSRKLNAEIKVKLELLKLNPEIGKKTNYKDIRGISLRHYSLFYTIKEDAIFILAFWDNRQSSEKLLKFFINKN